MYSNTQLAIRIFLLSLPILLVSCTQKIEEKVVKIPSIEIAADYAITNVAVLTMETEQVLENQTVLIKNGKILKIGNFLPAPNTTVIDGTGKYLMPGLTEMHAHIPVAKEGDDTLVKETLFLYLSQGITNIRGMLGDPYHLELRKAVVDGQILGPRIYTSSPSLNGNSIKTPEEAKAKITQYQKEGYDFLKIHPGIKLEVWEEVEKTANAVGIPYAGHVPVEVGINRAIAAGYKTVDHLDGYLEGLVPASEDIDPTKNGFFGYDFTNLADETLIDDLVDKTIQHEVGIVTTQTLFTRWFSPTAPEILANDPEMKYMSPKMLYTWRQMKTRLLEGDTYNAEQWKKFISIRENILRIMDKRGVTFLLGSDAPQVYNVPGFSLHRELQDMRKIGIENFKLLQAGTVNPAKFFGAVGLYGTVTEGVAADLILLNANPLADIQNTQKIEGVMVGNTWLSKERIVRELKLIEMKYAGSEE